jgi:hypothetical protein
VLALSFKAIHSAAKRWISNMHGAPAAHRRVFAFLPDTYDEVGMGVRLVALT